MLWFGDDAACDPSLGACGNRAQPVEGASRAIASGMEQNPTDIDDEELDDCEGKTAMSVSPTMLSVLAKNRAGTWWSSQRSRNPVWSFFCPADHNLGWEERGKAENIDCLICYAQR